MQQFLPYLISLILVFSSIATEASDDHLFSIGSTSGGEYNQSFYSFEIRFNAVALYVGTLPNSIEPVDHLYGTSSSDVTLNTSRSHITDPLALGLVKYIYIPSGEISVGASIHRYETCDIVQLNSTSTTYCNNRANDTDIALMIGYSYEITRGLSLGLEYSTVSGAGIKISLF